MNTYTPGPWKVAEKANTDGSVDIRIANASNTESNLIAFNVLPHNARLIASAPQLLAALRNIVEHYRLLPIDNIHHKEEPKDAIQKAISALAAAEKSA